MKDKTENENKLADGLRKIANIRFLFIKEKGLLKEYDEYVKKKLYKP